MFLNFFSNKEMGAMRMLKRINKFACFFLITMSFLGVLFAYQSQSEPSVSIADTIIKNGKIATLNKDNQFVSTVAVKDGKFIAIGSDEEILRYKGNETKVIDVKGNTVIPGLNDSHSHLIRGGS